MIVKIPEGRSARGLSSTSGSFEIMFERDELCLVLDTVHDELGRRVLSVLVSDFVCEILEEEVEFL